MKVSVRVKPGAKVEKVVTGEGGLVVYTRARAHDGEANRAVILALAEHFGVPKSMVSIVRGAGAREKVVEVLG